jgi:hypothetical protein
MKRKRGNEEQGEKEQEGSGGQAQGGQAQTGNLPVVAIGTNAANPLQLEVNNFIVALAQFQPATTEVAVEEIEVAVNTARPLAGYAWHTCQTDVGNSNVASRVTFKSVNVNEESITCVAEIKIAGRPSPKHSGSHGQHTTAFAANREVVAAATIGRIDEKAARKSLCSLFANLLQYPAFSGGCQQPQPPEQLKTVVEELANPESDRCKVCTLGGLGTLYLEIRDALPGASLNTGIDGMAGKSSRSNITGKAEGSALKMLRNLESAVLAIRKKSPDFVAVGNDLSIFSAAMRKLYDTASEQSGGLDDCDKEAQRATFLLSIAQAFPALFACGAGGQVVADMAEAGMPIPDSAKNLKLAMGFAGPLADDNVANARPMPVSFVAACVQDSKTNKCEISFAGRSESSKEGGTLGDHTCSEQLMKNAATVLLLGLERMPLTCKELAERLEQIVRDFDPGNYRIFDSGHKTDDLYKLSEEDLIENPLLVYQERFNALEEHVSDLSNFIKQLKSTGSAPATGDLVAEAAEKYMTLVDDRPTAVNFSGVASGHGEAGVLAKLNALEAKDSVEMTQGKPFEQVLGLLDCKAAYGNAQVFMETGKSGGFEAVLSRIAFEFLYFLSNAYPKVWQAIAKHFSDDAPSLLLALQGQIMDLATRELATAKENTIERQIGLGIGDEEALVLEKQAEAGAFTRNEDKATGRRSSGRQVKLPRHNPNEGYQQENKESEKKDKEKNS